MDVHIWGCSLYVLEAKNQQGQKLPMKMDAKSHSGYGVNLCDVPILSVSKMQIQIALSTTHKPLLGGQTFSCCRAPVTILYAVFPRMNPCALTLNVYTGGF
jgi:hypothetical protein